MWTDVMVSSSPFRRGAQVFDPTLLSGRPSDVAQTGPVWSQLNPAAVHVRDEH